MNKLNINRRLESMEQQILPHPPTWKDFIEGRWKPAPEDWFAFVDGHNAELDAQIAETFEAADQGRELPPAVLSPQGQLLRDELIAKIERNRQARDEEAEDDSSG